MIRKNKNDWYSSQLDKMQNTVMLLLDVYNSCKSEKVKLVYAKSWNEHNNAILEAKKS